MSAPKPVQSFTPLGAIKLKVVGVGIIDMVALEFMLFVQPVIAFVAWTV